MRVSLEPITYAYGVDVFFYGACPCMSPCVRILSLPVLPHISVTSGAEHGRAYACTQEHQASRYCVIARVRRLLIRKAACMVWQAMFTHMRGPTQSMTTRTTSAAACTSLSETVATLRASPSSPPTRLITVHAFLDPTPNNLLSPQSFFFLSVTEKHTSKAAYTLYPDIQLSAMQHFVM